MKTYRFWYYYQGDKVASTLDFNDWTGESALAQYKEEVLGYDAILFAYGTI